MSSTLSTEPVAPAPSLPCQSTASTPIIDPLIPDSSSSSTSSCASSSLSPSPPVLPLSLYHRISAAGWMLLSGLEYVGEVLADLLGITASRYQYVIDAKEREERRMRMEEEEEEEARKQLEERIREQQNQINQAVEEGLAAAPTPASHTQAADSTTSVMQTDVQ